MTYLYFTNILNLNAIILLSTFLWLISGVMSYLMYRSQKGPTKFGPEAMIGKIGRAITDLSPEGLVSIEGVLWRAISISGLIKEGTEIVVTGVSGNKLLVKVRG